MTVHELTGQTASHVLPCVSESRVLLHRDVIGPFHDLQKAAAAEGIEIAPLSGFRDFEKQSSIWNAKWRGERLLHDVDSKPVDFASLSEQELAHTILIWSALPGASRHHWGTEIDVIDAATRPPGYQVQLLPHEFLDGGYFHRLHQWLEENMTDYGFFFPYRTYQGGISTEPWHISYAPVSMPALQEFTLDVLREAVAGSQIEGKETVLEILPEIHRRYVVNINLPEAGDRVQ
jgi:LAS superfamily LD-carboxypeptidase LdcB